MIAILLAVVFNVRAQIPNNGFETWESYTDKYTNHVYQKPDLWNGSLPNNSVYSYSLTKNPESYPPGTGLFSLKIQADLTNGVRGVAISNDGADSMTNWIPRPSFALNRRPDSLYLYYKCFPYGGDTIIGIVYFYKNGVVIGNPSFGTTETVSNWTSLAIPMTYNNNDVPDSATILFVTGAYVQHSQSTLFLDNLSFNGYVTSVPKSIEENTKFNLYPNPASETVNLNIDYKNNVDLVLNIYNLMGTLVKSEKLNQNQQEVKVSDLNNGTYIIEIKSNEWTKKQKLIIE